MPSAEGDVLGAPTTRHHPTERLDTSAEPVVAERNLPVGHCDAVQPCLAADASVELEDA